MTVSSVEVLRGFDADGNAYRQLNQADLEYNTEVLSIIAAGDNFPRWVGANGEKQGIPFETPQLATLIAQCGVEGCDASPVTLYYQKISNLDGRVADTTTEHTKIDAADARMFIANITAGNRQMAMARGRITPISDGTNSPLIRTGSSAISDATPSVSEAFVLGPISVHQTKIKACDNFDLAFNGQELELGDESLAHITFAARNTTSPVLSWVTTDPTAPTYHKTAITTSAKFRCHLIRKKRHDERYADNETQHIRIEVVHGMILVQQVTGSPRSYRMELHATGDESDGFAGSPVTLTVNSAIALPS